MSTKTHSIFSNHRDFVGVQDDPESLLNEIQFAANNPRFSIQYAVGLFRRSFEVFNHTRKLSAQIDDLDSELTHVNAEVSDLRGDLEEREAELKSVNESYEREIEVLTEENKDLKKERDGLINRLDELEGFNRK